MSINFSVLFCSVLFCCYFQANAARDKLYDLRECNLQGQSGAGKDMSGIIAANADFSGVNFKEAQISKGFDEINIILLYYYHYCCNYAMQDLPETQSLFLAISPTL